MPIDACARSCAAGWTASVPPAAAALAERLGLAETARRRRAARSSRRDGVRAARSLHRRRRRRRSSGASAGCSRASTGSRSAGCGARSSRSRRPTSCASCSAGSTCSRAAQLHGRDGVRHVIAQLQGLELPGPAWERDVLPARIAEYDAGGPRAALPRRRGRLGPAGGRVDRRGRGARRPAAPPPRRTAPRSAPLAFVLRDDLPELLAPAPDDAQVLAERSPAARAVLEHLAAARRVVPGRHRARPADGCRAEVEDALWELVAAGLVTGDGIAGLRTLLLPERERRPRRAAHLRALPGRARAPTDAGRPLVAAARPGPAPPPPSRRPSARRAACCCAGASCSASCARASAGCRAGASLLMALRRLEARGEVRGGRFVDGFVGEQFALPEAVDALRSVRRRATTRRGRGRRGGRSAQSGRHPDRRGARIPVFEPGHRLSRRHRRSRSASSAACAAVCSARESVGARFRWGARPPSAAA